MCVMRWLRGVVRLLQVLLITGYAFAAGVRVCVIICRIKFILVVDGGGSMQDNGCLSGGGGSRAPHLTLNRGVSHTHKRRLFHSLASSYLTK